MKKTQTSKSKVENIIKSAIRDIPDFPKPGILFRDITPLLSNKALLKTTLDSLAAPFKGKRIDYVAGIEARGFLLASAIAYKLNAGLVIVRKKGKLPAKSHSMTYNLEYGQDTLEIHQDAFSVNGGNGKGKKPGLNHTLLVDDVLATGETAKCAAKLIEMCGGKVMGMSFLIELAMLQGRRNLSKYPLFSLVKY